MASEDPTKDRAETVLESVLLDLLRRRRSVLTQLCSSDPALGWELQRYDRAIRTALRDKWIDSVRSEKLIDALLERSDDAPSSHDASLATVDDEKPGEEPKPYSNKWRDGERLLRNLIDVLREAKRPMTADELVRALEARGWASEAKNKARQVSKTVWSNKRLFVGTPAGGFQLAAMRDPED